MLDLPLEARFTRADPRVDADRGCVALERGPLVYCLEAVDNPGHRLDDVVLDPDGTVEVVTTDEALPGDVVTLAARGRLRNRPAESWWPYPDAATAREATADEVTLTAVPYYVWGNRDRGRDAHLDACDLRAAQLLQARQSLAYSPSAATSSW